MRDPFPHLEAPGSLSLRCTRIIGVGQPLAGDDGAGHAVIAALRRVSLPAGIELHEVRDPMELVELLGSCDWALIIDAVLGGAEPGAVLTLPPDQLSKVEGLRSSHGVGVLEAIELARALHRSCPRIELVAIGIAAVEFGQGGLSAPVREAIARATAHVLERIE